MCGIFATTRPDLWNPLIGRVTDLLRHRGPDASGWWHSSDGSVLLIHTRLEVIGRGRAGIQPAHSTDGRIVLTYNGEAYNYQEQGRLVDVPDARSDTQVLCELLSRYGPHILSEVRGMYALVAWDEHRKALIAARDHWGIKPLYVLNHPSGGVSLASEISVLTEVEEGREIDPIGLTHYLAYGHTGSMITMFKHVSKLSPGTVTEWQRHESDLRRRSWSIETKRPTPMTLGAALDESVRAHLVADVGVGVFLSGGVDSTLIAALARKHAPGIQAFTIAFPDHPNIDESGLARANATALRVPYVAVPVTIPNMVAAVDKFILSHGEPLGDAAVLPLTVLSERAAVRVKVVLTGEGADELFGGYGRYRISKILDHRFLRIGSVLRSSLAARWSCHRTDGPRDRAIEALLWGGGMASHGALLGADVGWMANKGLPWATDVFQLANSEWLAPPGDTQSTRAQGYDEKSWLTNMYLEKTDRATMASSLEARVPYLDAAVSATRGNPCPNQADRPG